jgi:hypothetical protein
MGGNPGRSARMIIGVSIRLFNLYQHPIMRPSHEESLESGSLSGPNNGLTGLLMSNKDFRYFSRKYAKMPARKRRKLY